MTYGSHGPSAGLWKRRRGLIESLAFATAIAVTMPGEADARVRWAAPAECPQADDLVASLDAAATGRRALASLTAIDGQVERTKRGYTLTLALRTRGQRAQRVLSAEGCGELMRAAVWLVQLAAGPTATQSESALDGERDARGSGEAQRERDSSVGDADAREETAASAEQNSETAKAARATPNAPEEPATYRAPEIVYKRAPRELHVRVAGFGGVFAGAGAKAQGALGVWADLSFGALHTQATVADLLPANARVAGGGHVQLWSLAFGLAECALWGKQVHAGPCLGVEGLRTAAHSRDFGHDANRSVLWAAMDLGLQLLWPISRSLELNLAGSVGLPVSPRPRFTVAGLGVVASAERLSEQAHLGLIYLAH